MSDGLLGIAEKWWTPPPGIVGKLPRVTCKACSDKRCTEHKPTKCATCGAFISPRHIHLDFVGHADLTRTLIEIDADWQWEPVSFDEGGSPRVTERGNNYVLWGRLTLLGKSQLCVGTCEKSKSDADKELIGDMLRNGAMRFGIFGALWSKTDGWQDDDASPNETAPPVVAPTPTPTNVAATGSSPMPDPYKTANTPPDDWETRPLASMTFGELRGVAEKLNHPFSGGSKSELIRQLEPLVRAASGDEPWPAEGEAGPLGALAQGVTPARPLPEPDAIPFEPVLAKKQADAVRRGGE